MMTVFWMWEGVATQRCVFARGLAAHGIDTWAAMTKVATREWLSWPEAQQMYDLADNMREVYTKLKTLKYN